MRFFLYSTPLIFTAIFTVVFTAIFTAFTVQAAESPLLPGQLPRYTRSGGIIYRMLFDDNADSLDNDAWPDHWTRKRGIDKGIAYPAHLDLSITENRTPFGRRVLRFNMDGGGAAVFSPKIPVRRGMTYAASAFVSTSTLTFDDVYILLAFYNEQSNEPLKTVTSERIRNTDGWRQLEIDNTVADMPGVQSVSVGLLVIPNRRQDYKAKVDWTNVEIREMPTVSLSVPEANHLFFQPQGISVQCSVRGVDPEQETITFLLEDPFGRVIAKRSAEMSIGNRPASQFVVAKSDYWSVHQGNAMWKDLPIKSTGFYRIRATTPERYAQSVTQKLPEDVFYRDPLEDAEVLTLAVLPRGNFVPDGEFGWNLGNWKLDDIVQRQGILAQSGISRLKLPAWINPNNAVDRRTLNDFCDGLMRKQVGIVGLLQPIPDEVKKQVKIGEVNASSIFSLNPKIWAEPLQPVVRDLSLLVRDWQWTNDEDFSITDIPNFEQNFVALRKAFDANGFGLGIGYAQNWDTMPSTQPQPESEEDNGRFLALASSTPLAFTELQTQLDSTAKQPRRFVSLVPLSDRDYPLEVRITDLVRRMVIGKVAGADAVFLSKPIDKHNGVLRDDISPSELFLPWRVTSSLISGRKLSGQLKLPNHSMNYVFDDNGKSVLVMWNDKPAAEAMYFGDDVQLVDVWGKTATPEQKGRQQIVPVGKMPVFVRGLNTDIATLRLNFQLKTKEISSDINVKNPIEFSLKNTTAAPLSAEVSLTEPQPGHWTVAPAVQTLSLNPGETLSGTFDLTLTGRANTGLRPIQFYIRAENGAKTQCFEVFDELQIGDPNLSMEFSSAMNRFGEIEVNQAFVNNSDAEQTYVTKLIVPGRAIQQTQIVRQGFGRLEYTYILPRGKELLDAGVREITVRAVPQRPGKGQPMVYTIPLVSD